MYPTISDLINDIFGIYIPLPIQSFGFCMAISFIIAAWLVMLELKRKEKNGLISAQKKKVLVGKPASVNELLLTAVIGFAVGFKLLGIIFNYNYFSENPQHFLFSSEGSFIGGLAGAVVMAYLRYREKQKRKLDKPRWDEVDIHPFELTGNIIVYGALFGVIGAKIFNSLENIEDFINDPVDSLLSFSGLTFYGGLICAAIAIIWYVKKNKIPALVICDVAAPAIMIAYAVGRIGCQMAGDGDWGIPNTLTMPGWLCFLPDWFWAYDYPHNVLNEGVQIADCTGKHCFHLFPPVFPTPLYETIVCTIFFFILWVIRKRIKTTGILFSIFLIMNGFERFFIERIRVNTKYHIFGNEITQAEFISVLLFFAGIALFIYVLRKKKNSKTTSVI